MSPAVRLRTRNKKYVFLVMAMLLFAQKFPKKTLTVPLKMLKLIYGTGVGNQPLKGLHNLTWWTSDAEALPVFERIEPDSVTKPTKIVVAFRTELLAAAATTAPADYRRGLFSDVADVARAAFALAEREMLGDLRDWTIPNLAKAYRSRVLAAQTAAGSCVSRYVRICPYAGTVWCGSFTGPRRITVTFCGRERKSLRTLFWVRRQAPSLSRAGCVRDAV